MGHGPQVLRASRALRRLSIASLLAFAALSAIAPTGKAYLYWANDGVGTASNGTTLGRANSDGAGAKPSLVKNASGPSGVVSDGQHIYWANTQTSSIGRATIRGAASRPNFISPQETVTSLAIDSHYIYWVGSNSSIGRATLDGKQINKQCINLSDTPNGLSVSGGMIYVGEFERISRVAANCNNPTPATFVTLSANDIATDVTVAGGYLYWSELNLSNPAPASSIGRAPLSAPASTDESFVPGLYFPTAVVSDGKYLYWVDHSGGAQGNGAIGREQLATQTINYKFINDPRGPVGLAVDRSIDPTSTSVTCSPPRVAKNNPTVCTAVVHDSASSERPAGTVLFHGSASVFFPGGNTCTLSKRPTGGASCTIGAESAATGKHAVTGAYKGNPTHRASGGSATFCAGSKTVCNKP